MSFDSLRIRSPRILASRRSHWIARTPATHSPRTVPDDPLAAFAFRTHRRVRRCVVLTSTHPKVFSAGGDLGQFASQAPLVHKHFGTDRFPRRSG